MDCVACSLCAYSSAVEMAFTANLLLTAWAGVYNFLEDRYRSLASDADDLADDEYIQEEVSIQELRNTLDHWRRIRTTFWWIGLAFSVPSAVILYYLAWHGSPDAGVCGFWAWTSLMVMAYVGPAFMIAMGVAGFWGHKRAMYWRNKLKQQASKKRAEANRRVGELSSMITREWPGS